MSNPVPRAVVEAFYHALSMRDMDALAAFLDNDVVWTISGPVDILPFCGRRVGKDVVMKLLVREIPTLLSGRRFVATTMLVDGDRAAVLAGLPRPSAQVAALSVTASRISSSSVMKRSSTMYRSSTVLMRSNKCSATASTRMTGTGSTATLLPFDRRVTMVALATFVQ